MQAYTRRRSKKGIGDVWSFLGGLAFHIRTFYRPRGLEEDVLQLVPEEMVIAAQGSEKGFAEDCQVNIPVDPEEMVIAAQGLERDFADDEAHAIAME